MKISFNFLKTIKNVLIRKEVLFPITLVTAIYIGAKCVSHLNISHLEIPVKRNTYLIPKLNTFNNKNAIGGKKTVVENGRRIIKTGRMFIFNPIIGIVSMKMDRRINEATGLEKDRVDIYYISRTFNDERLVQYIRSLNNEATMVRVFYLTHDIARPWGFGKYLERIFLPQYYPQRLVCEIDSIIETFLGSRIDYMNKCKNYKLSLLFAGPYGSGKTSMVKYLSIKYGRDIYVLSLDEFFKENSQPISPILKACEGGILLLEDIDQFLASLYENKQNPYISKIQTLLDGLSTPEDTIIVLTADYLEALPDSLTRKGRIDQVIQFSYLTDEVIEKICKNYNFDRKRLQIKGSITTSDLINTIETNLNTLDDIILVTGKRDDVSEIFTA